MVKYKQIKPNDMDLSKHLSSFNNSVAILAKLLILTYQRIKNKKKCFATIFFT